MHEAKKRWLPGIEFYVAADMGLCGVSNDSDGNQRTAQYLSSDEAVEWLTTWLDGEQWKRERTASVSNQDSSPKEGA